jgi:hypothetical protein
MPGAGITVSLSDGSYARKKAPELNGLGAFLQPDYPYRPARSEAGPTGYLEFLDFSAVPAGHGSWADGRTGDTVYVPLIQHETSLLAVRIVLLPQHAQGGGLAIRRHLESVLTEADQVSPHCHSLHSTP